MFMNPGQPITPEEKKIVITILADLVRNAPLHESNQGFSFGSDTADFIRLLGWPQRRLFDLRGYLETTEAKLALSDALGWPLREVFASRSNVSVCISLDAPIDHAHNTKRHAAADRATKARTLEYWRTKGLPEAIDSALRDGVTPAEIRKLVNRLSKDSGFDALSKHKKPRRKTSAKRGSR